MHFAKPLLNTVHCVFGPQGDGLHGFNGGAHGICGGVPSYSGKQKQTALLPTKRQPLLGPHGFGVQSFPSGTVN